MHQGQPCPRGIIVEKLANFCRQWCLTIGITVKEERERERGKNVADSQAFVCTTMQIIYVSCWYSRQLEEQVEHITQPTSFYTVHTRK